MGRAPFGGPITLQIVRQGKRGTHVLGRALGTDKERAIGPGLAEQIFVEGRRKREA
jgi:hypothetical protein